MRTPEPRSHGVAPQVVRDVLRSHGRPLEPGVRSEMEDRLGHDFSRVRVHTDARAAQSARAVHADAYTVGTDVVFDRGRYAPADRAGRRLLAHELAHVVQQRDAVPLRADLPMAPPHDAAEHAAERAVEGGLAGASPLRVARQPKEKPRPDLWTADLISIELLNVDANCWMCWDRGGLCNAGGVSRTTFSRGCLTQACAGIPLPIALVFHVDTDLWSRAADVMASARFEFRPPAGTPATTILDESAWATYQDAGWPLKNGFSVATDINTPLPFTPPGPGRIDIHVFALEPTSNTSIVYDDSVPVVVCPGVTPTQPQPPAQDPPQQPTPTPKISVPTAVLQTGRWVYVEDADHPENYRLIRGTTDPAWDRPDRIAEVLLDGTGRYFWWRGQKVYLHGGPQ